MASTLSTKAIAIDQKNLEPRLKKFLLIQEIKKTEKRKEPILCHQIDDVRRAI
jgi:hypothetical protein